MYMYLGGKMKMCYPGTICINNVPIWQKIGYPMVNQPEEMHLFTTQISDNQYAQRKINLKQFVKHAWIQKVFSEGSNFDNVFFFFFLFFFFFFF